MNNIQDSKPLEALFSFIEKMFQIPISEKLRSRQFCLSFCFACSVFALVIGLLCTQSGTGISSDGTRYIITAENIYHGNGFTDFANTEYSLWPPLYPLAIAGLMLFGVGAEEAARWIPILCYALAVFPLFFLCRISMRNILASYLVCLAYLAFTPFLWISTWALTDMIYIFFSLLAILFLTLYIRRQDSGNRMLALGGFFTALANLTRFLGGVLLLIGLIAVVVRNVRFTTWDKESSTATVDIKLKRMIYQAILYIVIGFLPIFIWELYHQRGFSPGFTAPLTQVERVLRTLRQDFFNPVPDQLAYIMVAVIAVSFVLLIVYRKRMQIRKYLRANPLIISYLVIYPIALMITTSVESTEPISTRYMSPVYPFVMLTIIPLALYTYGQIGKPWLKTALLSAVTVMILLFVGFQADSSFDYYQRAKPGQGLNSPEWVNEAGSIWMMNNAPADATIYSNCAELLEFKLDRIVYLVPPPSDETHLQSFKDLAQVLGVTEYLMPDDEARIQEFFCELKNNPGTFVICIDDPIRTWRLSAEQVAEANEEYDVLTLVAEYTTSTIWRVP